MRSVHLELFSRRIVTGLSAGFLLLGITAGLLSGCSGKAIDENDPAALYQDAEDDIKNDHYQMALDKLRVIKNKFPYSKHSVDAQLRIADVYFMQESFAEAAQSYESFHDLHPKHERTPYAMFRIGLSHYKDMPGTIARDLAPAFKALEAFHAYLRQFPSLPDSKAANEHVAEIRTTLAEKDLYIGNFYFKRDQFDAAKARFNKVLELYPETSAAKEAKQKLQKISTTPEKKESPSHG